MKKFFYLLLSISIATEAAAQCENDRYREFIFNEFTVTSDLVYGGNINLDGESEALLLDVYRPTGDTETNRALPNSRNSGVVPRGPR